MDSTADDWLTGSDDGEGVSSGFSDFQDRASEWGNNMMERARENRQEGAKSLGRFAENGASKTGSAAGKNGAGNSKFMSAVQNAKDAEGRGGFANNVQGKTLEKAAAAAMPGGSMIVKQAKKFGPFGTILIVVTALVGIFSGAQSLAPFGFLANGLDQFNNLRTSMNRRTTYFRRFSLDKTRNKSVTKASIFSPEHFSISNSMKKKFNKQNIYYFGEADGYSKRFLVYTDEDTGKRYAVTARDEDIGGVPDKVKVEIDGVETEIEINTKMKIDDALVDSDNFARSFDVSTRTLKGHIAGWFDDLSAKLHYRFGSSRNKFKDAADDADEEDIKKRARTADEGGTDRGMSEDIKDDDGDFEGDEEDPQSKHWEEWDDEDGHHGEWVRDDVSGNTGVRKSEVKNLPEAERIKQIQGKLELKAKKIVAAAGTVANIGCSAMKVYMAINAIIAAIHVANVINYISGFFEAIDKTKAGDAGKSELAFYMNSLSEKGDTYGVDGETPLRRNTSSLESPAWNQFFSSGSVVLPSNDQVAQKFNREYVAEQSMAGASGLLGEVGDAIVALGGAAAAYRKCLYLEMTADAISAIGEGLSIVLDVALAYFTAGGGNVVKLIVQKVWKKIVDTSWLAVVVPIIVGVFSMFLPQIARLMARDLLENMAGEDAAYALNSGFNIYAGSQMQMSSGLPATKETLMAHWRAQQDVIAEEGVFERSMKSPFDPTSKYTFLGSIVNSLIPIANTWSSPLTTISKTAGTVGTALMSLRPTANAEGEARFETSLKYDCPNLKQIGVVGDVFCNPYVVTDMTTIANDPSYVIDAVATDNDKAGIDDNFKWNDENGWVDSDGDGTNDAYNPTINPGGELSKWVLACAVRDSSFGVVDSNVMNAIALINTGSVGLDTAVQTGIGMIPVVGDLTDIAANAKETVNFGWATGEKCVSEEYKYYSRYSEDQRMLESMGLIEKSSVAAFLDDYYEKNPIDNSYEGQIARYSGLTKNEVADAFEYAEAVEILANYDPTDYGPEKPLPKNDGYQYESNEIVAEAERAIVGNYIIFDDLRTKTKIA